MSQIGNKSPVLIKTVVYETTLSGDGVTTVFSLPYTPPSSGSTEVFISGVRQVNGAAYGVAGATLTFTAAPPTGTNNIYVRWGSPADVGSLLTESTLTQFPTIFKLTGIITPTQLAATTNDYNPTGLSAASTLRMSTNASRNLTGLMGGADGRLILIHNIGANNLVLLDESTLSAVANRFALSSDVTLQPDQSIVLQYDATSSRWRQVAGSGGSGLIQRGTLSGTTITGANMDVITYSAFDWTITGNSTVAFPTPTAGVPTAGTWYIDATINSTGGYDITWASGYNKVFGYSFDCLPNAKYRFWLVARSSSIIDVSVERIA